MDQVPALVFRIPESSVCTVRATETKVSGMLLRLMLPLPALGSRIRMDRRVREEKSHNEGVCEAEGRL